MLRADPNAIQERYDAHPYHSLPARTGHPAHLAMVATLLGLRPPPLARCRVLELGSGTGTNLLPIAADLPQAECVGIDISPRQVEISEQAAAALGLRNVRFHALDLMQAGAELGRFDYILAHGMYSWLPPPVRERLLHLCGALLQDDGLIFISYNLYPGWHLTGVLRDLFLFHSDGAAGPEERLAEVDGALRLLAEGINERSNPAARLLRDYGAAYGQHLARLGPFRDSALRHDILAEYNEPVYFRDFAAHIGRHGLQFVAESVLQSGLALHLPSAVRAELRERCGSAVDMEQYLDFLQMRMFRQSVLCRAGRAVAQTLHPGRLGTLCVRGNLRPVAARPDLASVQVERFVGPEESQIATNHPLSKAALCHLAAVSPAAVPFAALVEEGRRRLLQRPGAARRAADAAVESEDSKELARVLLEGFCRRGDLIVLRAAAPPVAGAVGERPLGRPLARLQARSGEVVTNLYHEGLELPARERQVLLLLDGQRDRDALCGELSLTAADLDQALEKLRQLALLVDPALDSSCAQRQEPG